jgi:thermitase
MAAFLRFGDPLPPPDFTRRLVTYTTKHPFRAEVELIDRALEPFAAKKFVEFELDHLFARVFYLGNLEKSVGDAIAQVAPQFSRHWVFERDVCMAPSLTPDDPLYSIPTAPWKWQAEQWALPTIQAEAAWTRVTAARGARPPVVVAIVDSGGQAGHEDFQSGGASTLSGTRILPPPGPNFADDTGHGTMLAGIIAAVSNNQLGIAGLGSIPIARADPAAPVDIPVINPYAIKCNDEVNRPTAAVAAAGMVYAVIQHARVINASWHVLDQGLLYSVISALGSQNPPVLVVAAAGNSGSDNTQIPVLPASYRGSVRGKPPLDNLIAVMATDHSDNKCEFSNYGANVDLAAPGEDILSTSIYFVSPPLPPPTRVYSPAYRLFSGTSASAAYVSAAAGLLLAIDDWTPVQIRDQLVASGDTIPNLQGAGRNGPRLNLGRAVSGPFSVTQPGAGVTLPQGGAYTVHWVNLYNAPIVASVAVQFVDPGSGAVLAAFPGLPNSGSATVIVPNHKTTQAIVRVRCEQKNLYADSAAFQIS